MHGSVDRGKGEIDKEGMFFILSDKGTCLIAKHIRHIANFGFVDGFTIAFEARVEIGFFRIGPVGTMATDKAKKFIKATLIGMVAASVTDVPLPKGSRFVSLRF